MMTTSFTELETHRNLMHVVTPENLVEPVNTALAVTALDNGNPANRGFVSSCYRRTPQPSNFIGAPA